MKKTFTGNIYSLNLFANPSMIIKIKQKLENGEVLCGHRSQPPPL